MEIPDPGNNFWSKRRWLSRLSPSFLIISAFLTYTGYRGAQSHDLTHTRVLLYYFSAMLALVMFVIGIRERHRENDDGRKQG